MKNLPMKNPVMAKSGRKLNIRLVLVLAALVIAIFTAFMFSGGLPGAEARNNSVVVLDYTLGVVDANGVRLIQTTDRQVAVDSNMYSPFNAYAPINITVGSPDVLAAFSEQLTGMKASGEKTFYIQPENAYGSYNPSLLQTFPLDMINATQLRIGSRITGDAGTGIVIALNTANATIDFNHPLAGYTLVYKVRVLEIK